MNYFCRGEMAERSNAAVLKTVDCHRSGGSNPSLSAKKIKCPFMGHFLLMELGKFTFQSDSNKKWKRAKPCIWFFDGDHTKSERSEDNPSLSARPAQNPRNFVGFLFFKRTKLASVRLENKKHAAKPRGFWAKSEDPQWGSWNNPPKKISAANPSLKFRSMFEGSFFDHASLGVFDTVHHHESIGFNFLNFLVQFVEL